MADSFRARIALATIVAGLAIAGVAAAVSPQGRGGPVPPGAPGQQVRVLTPGIVAILGRVVEAGTSIGVANVLVNLNSQALGATSAVFTNGQQGGGRRTWTDGEGRFVFRDLPVGNYLIATSAPGYVNGAYGQTTLIQVPRTLDVALARGLDIVEGDRVVPATIQIWKTAGIGGTVTDEAGEPLVGIFVMVMARTTDWSGTATHNQGSTIRTDDRGMYHTDLIPGDYVVAVLNVPVTMPAALVDDYLQAMESGAAATRAFDAALSASGANLDPRGTRVGDFLISGAGIAMLPPAATTADQPLVVYPTTYYPSSPVPATATIVSVRSGEERNGVNIQLRPVIARRVSGSLVGPDGPAVKFGLRLVADDVTLLRASPATMIEQLQTTTDATGRFTFLGVTPGRYILRALKTPSSNSLPIVINSGAAVIEAVAAGANSYTAPSEPILWATQSVAIADADLVDLNVTLRTGARVSGRAVFAGTTPAPTAEQLRSLTITPRAAPASNGAFMSVPTGIRLDPAHNFQTAEYVPGPYTIVVTGFPAGWIVKSVMVGGIDGIDRAVELPPDGLRDLTIVFTDRISKLSGTVAVADAKPAASAAVFVYPVDSALWRKAGISNRRTQSAPTDRFGRYTFTGLPPGDYFLIATDTIADFSDPKLLTAMGPRATRISIAEGGQHTQDLRVVVLK